MKQPNLKARLISSVLVLVMMITSLLGTTFAWFTDLAVSGGNTIQVGSLKVGLYHKVGEDDWKSIKDNSNHKIFDYDKWEPGYTRFETLKIANLGNLALQYKLSIEVAGRAVTGSNGENLADVIDVYVVDGENTSSSSWTYKGTLTQVMRNPSSFIGGQLLAREENVVSIALRMQTTAGNAYQGLDVGDIYVNLVATQWNYEKDSFDNPDYDKDSTFPELNIGGVSVSVNTNYNNVVTNTVSVSGEGVEATIPAGVEVDNGVNKLTLSVTEKENSDANLTLNDGEALRSLDVHISGVSKDNEKPMLITVEKAMKVGLNMGNYTLYHVEDGVSNAMTAVDSLAELDEHNEFYYDPATGDVTLAMATFSEVAFVAETNPVWKGEVATAFAGGTGDEFDPYLIANADQLAYLGDLISNDNANYGDKHYKLVADINLGGEENASKGIIFYPIGYHKVGGTIATVDIDDAPEFIYHETDPAFTKGTVNVIADAGSTTWYTYGGAFKGVFDGNGNTISNIYQNTWQMKGNYDGNYWNSAMGVFGYVYGGTVKNLTVDNFSSDGEFTPTGVIAAYAAGKSTFENIAITNCNPRVYNTGNGGIIGIAGSTTNANDDHIILKNITVDNSNKISALWGSWDVACGGLVGMYRGNVDGSGNATGDTISFENCHVSAQIDVYNDVCANYQYYAYRYSGMIIGSVRHNTTNSDGRTVPNMAGISASGCTVNYGDWNDYYYCEFEKNTMASYSEDYQFSRVPHSELNFTDSNGNGVVDADERSSVTGCKHNHTAAENHQAVYLPFYQLFTGYSWGVSSIGLKEYSGIVTNLGITEGDQQGSVEKFEGKVETLKNYTTYKLGNIFSFVDNGVKLIPSSIVVSVTNVDETNPVSATIVYNYTDWEDTTIKFTGVGVITITIQDYYFCTPTTITVTVEEHVHTYDNACDTTCNMCQATREVDAHVYDNSCDTTCNVCGAERTIEHTVVIDQAVAPTCTEKGLTEGKHCSVCNTVLVAQEEVAALGHKYDSVVTEPDCENDGYTTYTCSVCRYSYTADKKEALGHSFNFESKFSGDFLYRVGNKNAVSLNSLFEIHSYDNIKVEFISTTGVSGTYSDSNKEIQFTGTGVVIVKVTDKVCGKFAELELEVVDAVNATSATSATSNNVVLLNDCGFSSLEVSGGYTLYGNGFTMTCGSDTPALDTGYAFVTLNNGTLDNVQIVCPNFDYAVLYKSNMTESGNRSQTTDRTRYYNVKSGVMVSGNSQILNSRISGARAAVNVTGGNCLIDNSRIELGAVASLLIGSANSVTLRDVTLVQKPTASTYDSSKVLMGFSVLFVCDADGNTAPVTLEGTLVQNAWVNESDKQYVPSAGQSIISTVLSKTDYLHDIDGDGTKESLNLGFAYMPESLTSKVNTTTITDDRTNKNDIPYAYAEVSILNGKTYVYSYKNASGTADSFKTESEYAPNKQGDNITVNYSDTTDGLESGKSYGTDGWVYELNVDLDVASGYKLDFSKLSMTVNGVPVTDFKVNGSAKPTSPVAVIAGGVTYTLTATVNGKEYTATFKVTGTETSKESPSKISGPTTAGFGVAKSYGGDWSGAADVLTGVKVKYWSVAENKYVEFDFSNFTVPGNAGKLNGTNSYWEYTHTNNDFTLKVTNTVAIHSGKSVYGMPIRGTDGKLYFTISSTNGYVGTGTTSRAVTMQYEFTDNNGGEKLTFTYTFNISYNKDDQYSYSDLSGSGKLTKLGSSSGGSSDGCVTPDTLVTLADGTQVRVDSLTGSEELLVWNMETGKLDKASIMFVDSDAEAEVEVIKLHFSDGTVVNVIYEHGFWDYDLNKYVYLDKNAEDYIGHTFAKKNGDTLEKVQLVDVVIETELTTAWSPVTAGHLCYFVNGMLSMPGGVGGLFNIFDVNPETMTYDYEQMEKDIETYGLYTYEELNAICPLSEDMFNAAGGAYLKISIGKGNLTEEELFAMINRYSKFFN